MIHETVSDLWSTVIVLFYGIKKSKQGIKAFLWENSDTTQKVRPVRD
ncbi:hypothetical protein [Levilactobacillus yonginensis]|nr:hypothetical protein [Levilactobacillus yonginensis]